MSSCAAAEIEIRPLRKREITGCIGVVCDAKPEGVAFYERFGFVPLAGLREGSLHGEPLPMFLAMATDRVARQVV